MIHQSFIALALLAAASLVAGFFAYIYNLKRQFYLLLWTAGWGLFALHYLGPALQPWLLNGPLETALDRWIYALAALCFFLGAQIYSQRKPWYIPAAIVAAVLGLWALANGFGWFTVVPVFIPSALLFAAVAVVFWQESRRQETLADRMLAVSFLVWAALRIALFVVFRNSPEDLRVSA